ncbi:MAG: SusD/RagB family nutrient-binding outer membrane lipoprotein [Flavobacterium sp.]|nr:SusD/RagB family nutrient-binding outer membrane lipoprotein [Pedobacter sp.]
MKKIISIILLSLTVGISACQKDYFNLETNPNSPSVATPGFLLSGSLKVTGDIVNTNFATFGVWMQYWTPSGNYVPNANLFTYNYTDVDYQVWTQLYSNASNYDALEKRAAADPALANFQAIASIMKAYDFQALVDVYNNVPYTEAFKGIENISPAYDKGEFIYDDLLVKLDQAIALIKSSGTAQNPGNSDIMYGGVMTNWVKFANTLKLRIVIRQSNLVAKKGALTANLQATAADGYIDGTSGAEINPGYSNSDALGGQQSPFWRIYGFDQNNNVTGNNDYYRASSYAIGKLNSYNDPRVSRFYETLVTGASAGTIRGNVFGDPNARSNATTSGIGPGLLKDASQNAVIFSAAEALFLQAEGAETGLVSGSAQAYYEAGITASFTSTGVPTPDAAAMAYYGQAIDNVGYVASTNKIQAIITQKWAALNGYGHLESYNEYRRTGFPADVPRSIAAGTLGTTIPSRIFYPSTEYQQNAANVANEGTIDRFTSKIFWAK